MHRLLLESVNGGECVIPLILFIPTHGLISVANTWTGTPDRILAMNLAVRTSVALPILAGYIATSVKSTGNTAVPRQSVCALTKTASAVPG